MKPVPFIAALVPALAAMVFIATLRGGCTWYAAAGLFYAALALAEWAYLGAVFARTEGGQPAVARTGQDRSAKIGVAE